jgi:hypothetical protein
MRWRIGHNDIKGVCRIEGGSQASGRRYVGVAWIAHELKEKGG